MIVFKEEIGTSDDNLVVDVPNDPTRRSGIPFNETLINLFKECGALRKAEILERFLYDFSCNNTTDIIISIRSGDVPMELLLDIVGLKSAGGDTMPISIVDAAQNCLENLV